MIAVVGLTRITRMEYKSMWIIFRIIIKIGYTTLAGVLIMAFALIYSYKNHTYDLEKYIKSLDGHGLWTNGLYTPILLHKNSKIEELLDGLKYNNTISYNDLWNDKYIIRNVIKREIYPDKGEYEFYVIQSDNGIWVVILKSGLNHWWNRIIRVA